MALKGKILGLPLQPAKPAELLLFHQWLRNERRARNLSQKQLGDLIGYSQSYISDIENENKPASDEFRLAVEGLFSSSHP